MKNVETVVTEEHQSVNLTLQDRQNSRLVMGSEGTDMYDMVRSHSYADVENDITRYAEFVGLDGSVDTTLPQSVHEAVSGTGAETSSGTAAAGGQETVVIETIVGGV
ncbi:hypothetical protein [Halorientalis sp.]|jgi:hypothetical protein|uniref:hypothetical protein n=1 Tax=Halorientalis sp. TaxID=1931229 RepID=UPI002615784C|nr:hypothetical protein [Halorientalis sp.]